jgi:predicted nucleic acid-binding protein
MIKGVGELISTVERVAFDTSPIIYFIEGESERLAALRPIFRAISRGKMRGVVSTLVLMEVLIKPLEAGRGDLAEEYRELLTESFHFGLIDVSVGVAEQAAEIRAEYGFRAPDSIQIATAVHAGCDCFVTNDKRLREYSGIEVVQVDELEV